MNSGHPRPGGSPPRHLAERLPPFLFRVGLAPVLGGRLLLLHHTGRVTGRYYRTVLAVLDFDAPEGRWTVAAAGGDQADWYRNLRTHPKTVIQYGNHHHTVNARFPDAAESEAAGAALTPPAAWRHCPRSRARSGPGGLALVVLEAAVGYRRPRGLGPRRTR
ncbi:nitroreductase family deazaflavin-dependent oxidoreductase [Streptomyces albidoflavus]|uniref:Nitroreductase family deazaflavin-dependent oxidoreductase n=1 Tax=Streptomyces albidoflavus TaxID=1886 RepID=A0ABY3HA70_9ACTN|nr:nitroreductase family deazaflavin-dependent oxidoreductase [Streptomyces albidoflavus]TWV29127.1 nitroreductase family deazaflavin-dependent oxidoreductase [Streptomyces albidoflavus]